MASSRPAVMSARMCRLPSSLSSAISPFRLSEIVVVPAVADTSSVNTTVLAAAFLISRYTRVTGPAVIRSPERKMRGSEMRTPLTRLPFVLPRSRATQWVPSRSIARCSRDRSHGIGI